MLALTLIIAVILILNASPRKYTPGEHPRKGPFFSIFTIHHRKGALAHEKTHLKMMGTTVAVYFSNQIDYHYPKDPQDLLTDQKYLKLPFLKETDKELPQNWQCPDNWQDFNKSSAPYIFLRSENDIYTGSSSVPIFIIKDTYQAQPNYFSVVYEDGHVAVVKKPQAKKIWQSVNKN